MPATQVMIVEDESVIALDIKQSLNRLGYSVCGMAASGDSALRKIATNRPDVILMDIHLKGEMTGIDVSERVKSDFQIPIVYLTANADSSTFQEAKGTDPYGYILKPFDEKELGIAIEIALHQHQKGAAVRSSERWYATAFQSLNDAVIATDTEGLVVFMNAASEALTGYRLADVVNQPIEDVLVFHRKIKQLDQVKLSGSVSSILEAAMRGRATVPFPHNALVATQDSKTAPVEGGASAIRDVSGNIIGTIFIFKQIQDSSLFGAPVPSLSAIASEPTAKTTESLDPFATISEASTRNPIDDDSDDAALVRAFTQAFIQKQSVLLSTPNLVAEASRNSTQLKSKKEGIIINVKLVDNKVTAVVKQDSAYWELIRHILIENSFFPVGQRTNGTHYYQHRTIPEQYQIYHTSASELREVWYGKSSLNQSNYNKALTGLTRESIIVLRRGSWYHIRRLDSAEGNLRIQTIGGEMFLALEDSLIWGTHG